VEDVVGRGAFAAALAEERLLLVGAALRTNLAMKITPKSTWLRLNRTGSPRQSQLAFWQILPFS
jgi:hypothetical protein